MLESVDDVVLEIDADNKFINVWNQRGDLLMRPREELIGATFDVLMPGELPKLVKAASTRVLGSGQRRNDGSAVPVPAGLRWFSARLTRIPAEAGARATMCAVVRDVTERRAAEEELKRAKEAAEAANRAKSDSSPT